MELTEFLGNLVIGLISMAFGVFVVTKVFKMEEHPIGDIGGWGSYLVFIISMGICFGVLSQCTV